VVSEGSSVESPCYRKRRRVVPLSCPLVLLITGITVAPR